MTSELKPLPIRSNHNCFACSPRNPAGLRMKFFTDDQSVSCRLSVPPHLCGWDNMVHGGIISTILDEIMSWSAIYLLKKIILTKSIFVEFLKPILIGDVLDVKGSVMELKTEREAMMEGVIYINDKLCAKSKGTFALLTPDVARKLGVIDENALKDMEPILHA